MAELHLGEQIGKGGFGTVYLLEDYYDLCVKISNKNYSCRKWSDEYKKLQDISFVLLNQSNYNPSLLKAEILKPVKYIEDRSGTCYMIMPYISRPDGIKNIDDDRYNTVQPMFGEKDMDIIYHGRGQFIGLEQIYKIVPNVNRLCYDIGYVMGLIHFVAKNDAYDIELFLGKSYEKDLKVYIADFDLTESIQSYDESMERIVWSLQAVPYFPVDVESDLYTEFFNGYRKAAKEGDIPDKIVEQIISEYSM